APRKKLFGDGAASAVGQRMTAGGRAAPTVPGAIRIAPNVVWVPSSVIATGEVTFPDTVPQYRSLLLIAAWTTTVSDTIGPLPSGFAVASMTSDDAAASNSPAELTAVGS